MKSKIKELNKAIRTLKEYCYAHKEDCYGCVFSAECLSNDVPCNWKELKERYEITALEKEILKHAKAKGFNYIARDEDKNVCLYEKKPFKTVEYGYWDDPTDAIIDLFILSDLFSFVKWEDEEPISINYVLKNCVVLEETSNKE